jgi:hypothetical protein
MLPAFVKKLWGADQGLGFKVGAWAVALGLFAGHHYFYADKRPKELQDKAAKAKRA